MDQTRRKELFAELLGRHRSQLFGYVHALVRNLHDADDVFQQTTVILWEKFNAYDPRRSFLAWACGVARLEAATLARARGRQRVYFTDQLSLLLAEAHGSVPADEADDERAALGTCIDKLREADRRLLRECYLDDTEVNAVARRQGRSPQSVHNSLRRIRRALFACISRRLAGGSRPREAR